MPSSRRLLPEDSGCFLLELQLIRQMRVGGHYATPWALALNKVRMIIIPMRALSAKPSALVSPLPSPRNRAAFFLDSGRHTSQYFLRTFSGAGKNHFGS